MGTLSLSSTGARAKLYINGKLAGVFGTVDYNVSYSAEPIYILGRYNAAEIAYTGMAAVAVNCSGIRVVNDGPYVIGSVPQLQGLLNHQDITLTLVDRQTGITIMTVNGVRPIGFSEDAASRGLHNLTVNFLGTTFGDESGPQSDVGAVTFG